MPLTAKPADYEVHGIKVRLTDYVEAWEATPPDKGICLRSAPASAMRGAVFFFPDPHAAVLREALKGQVQPTEPVKGVQP